MNDFEERIQDRIRKLAGDPVFDWSGAVSVMLKFERALREAPVLWTNPWRFQERTRSVTVMCGFEPPSVGFVVGLDLDPSDIQQARLEGPCGFRRLCKTPQDVELSLTQLLNDPRASQLLQLYMGKP